MKNVLIFGQQQERSIFWREGDVFSFGHVKFEPIRHYPSGNVQLDINLEHEREIWAKDTHLRTNSMS